MKTDLELLTLAAKAFGIAGEEWDYTLPGEGEESYFALRLEHGDVWSPLHDDGDAFRLAVKLNFQISYEPEPDGPIVLVVFAHLPGILVSASEELLKDACVATRRAIVRAAAQIGEVMP